MSKKIKNERTNDSLIFEASVQETSITGISLFVLRRPEDKIVSTVSISMKTEIAEYLRDLVNFDQISENISQISGEF